MATSPQVEIPCPRCSGRGVGSWQPDKGICYRCGGHKVVKIDIARHQAALRHLRTKFVELRTSVREAEAKGYDAGLARELLANCVQDGLRVRADLEAAGAEV